MSSILNIGAIMQDADLTPDEDDEPVVMTSTEWSVWAYLVTVVLTSGTYLTLMAVRLAGQPVDQVEWVVPMLWTLGVSVLGTVALTIVLTIAGTITTTIVRHIVAFCRVGHGDTTVRLPDVETEPDARDKEISLRGDQALVAVLGAGFVGALVLAMLDADTFWIGNLLFVVGTLGAIAETTTRIRLYRRGF
ncbi:hypothetical protein [Actinotalea sp. K2]|uniref:hypothetical protein n=1 Tax=Actinotalea sp. K2 TaxID=2939438 RepID=UPI0020175DB5|nr:hypothetical protein [Actinotalea sp. K2]MCL3860635.1 hypothetical protein [Actinotalea sp. K2]